MKYYTDDQVNYILNFLNFEIDKGSFVYNDSATKYDLGFSYINKGVIEFDIKKTDVKLVFLIKNAGLNELSVMIEDLQVLNEILEFKRAFLTSQINNLLLFE